MLIRAIAIAIILSACAEDVELTPLTETHQESSVCELRRFRCDPYDPGANERCNMACGDPGHCLEYSPMELRWCELHPGEYVRWGYCNPFGEPTWPTHCVDGFVP